MPISAVFASTFLVAKAVLAAVPTLLAVHLTSEIAECPAPVQVQSAL